MTDVAVLLTAAEQSLAEARAATRPNERYAAAHLAGLRAAAAVVATRPTLPHARRRKPTSVWTLLAEAAPEMAEWATFYAASATKRAAAEAAVAGAVNPVEASDLLRESETFLALVRTTVAAKVA